MENNIYLIDTKAFEKKKDLLDGFIFHSPSSDGKVIVRQVAPSSKVTQILKNLSL